MIKIAHRGNTIGINSDKENHPDYIDVINNIINRLTNVLDMYINRLQNDLHNRSEPQVFHVMAKSEEELFNLV